MLILSLFKKDGQPSVLRRRSNGTLNHLNISLNASIVRQFYIELKEPHRIWKPEEYISGEAVLIIKRDITNIALRLILSSEIKVRAGTGATGRRKRCETLFEKSTLLYGDNVKHGVGNDKIINGLTKGEHRFPFRIRIPSGRKVFSSIKFERGSIRHFLQCQIESAVLRQTDKPVSFCQESFSVIVPTDVSELPPQKVKKVVLQSASMVRRPRGMGDGSSSSLTKGTTLSTASNSSGGSNGESSTVDKTVTISVDIPHSGFAIGEIVPINVSVKHYKEFCHPAGLIVTLTRICRVSGGGKDEPMETFRKDLCQSISPLYVDAKTLGSDVTVYLKIPIDTFSTFTSLPTYFIFQYYIEVVVNLSQKNIVYTESNRAIGVPSDTVSSQQDANLEGNLNQLQRKLLMMVSNDTSINDENNIESNIFYKDMVNVEKLKRQSNVTGMSIETVIGTIRSQASSSSNEPSAELDQTTKVVNDLTESPLTSDIASPKRSGEEWLNPPYVYDQYPPVPQYTPNGDVHIVDDKQEMEYIRLKQLESGPPTDY